MIYIELPLIMGWVGNYTADELYRMGQEVGLGWGKVLTAEDLMNSEQLKAREFFIEVEHPEAGRLRHPSSSYKFSKMPRRLTQPAPLLGQHNEEIYCGRLNYGKLDLTRFRQSEII